MSFQSDSDGQTTGSRYRPISSIYSLNQQLSENELTQSWLATENKTGQPCFIKVSKNDSIGQNDATSILGRSFDLQKLLKSNCILTSVRKSSENGHIFIEYPLLNREKWQTLDPKLFWQDYPSLLIEIFTIIDYLHLLGLVHCDLKFENFQIDTSGKKAKAILIDLDFLTKSYTSPALKIFGTPEHIAPEISSNQEILIESDNYSIGAALNNYLKIFREDAGSVSPNKKSIEEKISNLVKELTANDPLRRPTSLIMSLLKSEIIDKKSVNSAQKTLFAMKLLTDFRNVRSRVRDDGNATQEIISPSNGVFGISEDLTNLLSAEMKSRPHHGLQMFIGLLRSSELERYGDYWHVDVPDEMAWDAFKELKWEDNDAHQTPPMHSSPSKADVESFIKSIISKKHNDGVYPIFLALKFACKVFEDTSDAEYRDLYCRTLKELAVFAQILGRFHEAEKYLISAISEMTDDSAEKCQLFYDLSHMQLIAGKTNEFVKSISNGKTLCERLGENRLYRIFQRQEAWLIGAKGDFEKADFLLSSLLEEALKDGWLEEAAKILTTKGVISLRKGEFMLAETLFIRALNYSKKQGIKYDLIILYSNLALLYFEMAQYTKSIKFGRLAVEIAEETSQQTRLSAIYVNLMLSYTRLADYKQAEFWLNKYLTGKTLGLDKGYFQNYYLYYGNLMLKKGRLQKAREILHHSLSLISSDVKDRNLGKLHHTFALLAFQTGNHTQFLESVDKAKTVFRDIKDAASLLEVDFINGVWAVYDKPSNEVDRLIEVFDQLLKSNNRFYASLCLFYILLYGNDSTQRKSISDLSRLSFISQEPKVPLFQAVLEIIEANKTKGTGNTEFLLHLKTAYRVLNNSGDRYNSLLICLRIGETYKSMGLHKLAKKFLQQAYSSAQAIGHSDLLAFINQRLLESPNRSLGHFVNSLRDISEILDNIDDRDLSLSELVRYAVNETGAERGVLLLRADPQSQLMVKAVVNCDTNCLDDIRQFSNSIANAVAVQQTPLIIDNAMEDNRTKKYKSIMFYNILSVICVPIRQDEYLKGVLYLDHHTIPALFEKEDITFIHAIANFISVLLRTVSDYSNQISINKQLTEDILQLGGPQAFVTQNAMMCLLFSKLPEIAKSNASILLMGASGTGKEIIAQMIHDESLRAKGPMIKLNCAAIPASLIESELFGVAKSAATGVEERHGKLWAADGGTLFFDEIGDMPMDIQSKILRAIEYQRFERVGSNRSISTDIRFIYATNKNLKNLIKQGKFREDLYYRINTITINIPPLSERADDIPLLLTHFLKIFSPSEDRRPFFSTESSETLISYPWPGNVRELRNFVEKCCIYFPGKKVELKDLPLEFWEHIDLAVNSREKTENVERLKIKELLLVHNWNQSEVARLIRLPLSTLRRKIKKYQIFRNPQ
jgi:Nif-specific regulatory protein